MGNDDMKKYCKSELTRINDDIEIFGKLLVDAMLIKDEYYH